MRRTLVVVSLAIHLAVIAVLFVTGMWQLERMETGKHHMDLAVISSPPEAPAGGAKRATPKFDHKVPPKHTATEPVQPTPPPEVKPEVAATLPGEGSGGGSGSDVGPGSGSGSATSVGTCTENCGQGPVEKPLPKNDKPIVISPVMLRELRISGETQIQPPDPVKTTMMRDGTTKTRSTFKICLSIAGDVSDVRMLKSSRYAEYDAVLIDGLHRWRYRPYMVNGLPTPVCSVVTFDYEMK